MITSKVTTLDVREDFSSGAHPCDKIHSAIASVAEGETLRLLVPFEPIPLFDLAARKGLGHKCQQAPEGHWEVFFAHDALAEQRVVENGKTSGSSCNCSGNTSDEIIEVDARGLVPPQPMVKILEALASLSQGGQLHARTDRRPVHLYAQLEARGFAGETREQGDGSFITTIRHA
jgi:uncharacterized protein (DUF2249 family)